MRRHLPATGVGVDGRADGAVEHLGGGHAQRQAERAVAVVHVEPVVRRLEDVAGSGQHGFVAGARDLEEDLVLPLELDLPVVDAARQEHRSVGGEELVAREPVGRALGRAALRLGRTGHESFRSRANGWPSDRPGTALSR